MSLSHLSPETRRLIRSLKPYDVVIVTWEDAYTVIRDTTLEAAHDMADNEKYIRNTLGFVARADDEYVVLAGTDDRGASSSVAEVADLTVLCTGFIRAVQILRREK